MSSQASASAAAVATAISSGLFVNSTNIQIVHFDQLNIRL
jgi:hypothetical protein